MKLRIYILVIVLLVTGSFQPAMSQHSTSLYPGNRAPLKTNPYTMLPIGNIDPRG
ncbi:MAG: hypothetical protein KIT80_09705 [Chitinophagaceae bacterium]|nr:hypothetical protein [Chitinophagaceae bacterium]MCW5927174.1 hypothetical protein [Chitinophagaceae bacterium]